MTIEGTYDAPWSELKAAAYMDEAAKIGRPVSMTLSRLGIREFLRCIVPERIYVAVGAPPHPYPGDSPICFQYGDINVPVRVSTEIQGAQYRIEVEP